MNIRSRVIGSEASSYVRAVTAPLRGPDAPAVELTKAQRSLWLALVRSGADVNDALMHVRGLL